MARHAGSIQFLELDEFDALDEQPLQIRVEDLLRRAILSGNLGPDSGPLLTSSRPRSRHSRHTVERAFDQFVAAGFLVRRRLRPQSMSEQLFRVGVIGGFPHRGRWSVNSP